MIDRDLSPEQELQRQRDRAERDSIRLKRQQELEENLKKQQEIEDKITQAEIDAYDRFMQLLGEENITEAFTRIPPRLDDFEKDAMGRDLSYERSHVRKPADAPLALSEEHVHEINYCFQHPIYMIKNYIKIINQDRGLMNFVVYPYQAEFIKDCFKHKRVISCWSRQSGKCESSTISITYAKKPTSFIKRFVLFFLNKFFPDFIKIKFVD